MVRRLLSSPAGWLWSLVSLAALPMAEVMTPVGVLGHASDRQELLSQVGFISCLAGSTIALGTLGGNEWTLTRAGAVEGQFARWAGVGSGGALGALIVTLSALLLTPMAPTWGSLMALTLMVAHLTVVGGALLACPGSTATKTAAFPLLTWVLPSLMSPGRSIGQGLAALLQAYRDTSRFLEVSPVAWLWSAAPVIAVATATLALSMRTSTTSPR